MQALRVRLRVAAVIRAGRRGARPEPEPTPRETTPKKELRIEALEARTPASPIGGS